MKTELNAPAPERVMNSRPNHPEFLRMYPGKRSGPLNRRSVCLKPIFPGFNTCVLLALFFPGSNRILLAAEPDHGAATNSARESSRGAFVGSQSCRECHESFYRRWVPSHHGLAMQPFTAELAKTRLTPSAQAITAGSRRYRVDLEKAVMLEQNPAGNRSYSLAHVLGGKNVYYFLTPLERGRFQVLPVAYDVNRRTWYDTAASAVRHFASVTDEALDWRESAFTFNTSCYGCHVSQLERNYDLASDTYHTTWSEPGINCETCHGSGAEHVRVARSQPKGQPLRDLKIISTKPFSPDQMNSLCASCHAKLAPITTAFQPGDRFFDHFGLVTLEQADFYPDGRDLGENFTLNSWRLNPCLKSGRLHCVTCHTSSGRFRFPDGQADQACLPCHAELVKNAAAHAHHPAGTAGARCVSCHLPVTEFARMRRSDHSLRPPMPAATLALGSPNACNLCHTNQTPAWADRTVRQWYARDYQAPVLQRAGLIAAARKADWTKLPDLVAYLQRGDREEIWTASLIHLLRQCDTPAKWPGIRACLTDPSPLVRAAAVEALGDQLRPDTLAPLLAACRDEFRLVRIRAAGALAAVPREWLNEKDTAALAAATDELLASFLARPDQALSHYNLGNFRMDRQEFGLAIESFETALRLQPQSLMALVNVSLAYNATGHNDRAEASLQLARKMDPTNAVVSLNLGLLWAEMDKLAEAEQSFRTALRQNPGSAQAAFNLGLLVSKNQPVESLRWLRRAVDLQPEDPRYNYTLAFHLRQQGQTGEAQRQLEKVSASANPYPDACLLLGQIYEEQKMITEALALYRRAGTNENLPESLRRHCLERLQSLASPPSR